MNMSLPAYTHTARAQTAQRARYQKKIRPCPSSMRSRAQLCNWNFVIHRGHEVNVARARRMLQPEEEEKRQLQRRRAALMSMQHAPCAAQLRHGQCCVRAVHP